MREPSWFNSQDPRNGEKCRFKCCLLDLNILSTSAVILEWVATCDSVHSWLIYNAATLGYQAVGTLTSFPCQSHYPFAIFLICQRHPLQHSCHDQERGQLYVLIQICWLDIGFVLNNKPSNSGIFDFPPG